MMIALIPRRILHPKICIRQILVGKFKRDFCRSSFNPAGCDQLEKCKTPGGSNLTRKINTPIEHVVIVSKSDSIFTNLALEEWLYENEDLTKKSILLLWKNKPTVVIGRHQNPWLECNVEQIVDSDIDLARRTSGGGTVYHDNGNLNCSFIKDRKFYNRKLNLELVVDAVTSMGDIDLSINCREDIILDQLYKVSGTASKLGGKKTFHHFTLLYDVDTESMSQYLNSPLATVGVKSRATQSLRSSVKNISDYIDVDFNSLVNVIGRQFLNAGCNIKSNGIQWLLPDEISYPGLSTICNRLKDWEWIYGKTPKFTINKCFARTYNSNFLTLEINTEINKGRISDLKIVLSPAEYGVHNFIDVVMTRFINVKYWRTDLAKQFDYVFEYTKSSHVNSDICQWILYCFQNSLCYKFKKNL